LLKLLFSLSGSVLNFANWIPLAYHKELEIKEATETASSASFSDIYNQFDTNGQLSTSLGSNIL
jgi:hypothetical protein